MKKVLALVLVLVMAASLLVTPAFAAGSKTDVVEIVPNKTTATAAAPEKDATVETKVEGATITDSTAPEVKAEEIAKAVEALTKEEGKAFKDLGIDVATVKQTVVSQKDVKVEDGKTAKMTVKLDGVKGVYVVAWLQLEDGTMKLLGVGEPPLDVELTESGLLVITTTKK